jgi:hypothetical protein
MHIYNVIHAYRIALADEMEIGCKLDVLIDGRTTAGWIADCPVPDGLINEGAIADGLINEVPCGIWIKEELPVGPFERNATLLNCGPIVDTGWLAAFNCSTARGDCTMIEGKTDSFY